MAQRWDTATDGPFDEGKMRQKFANLGYSVHRYVYPPGTVFSPHEHSMDKLDGVVSGQFELSMKGETVVLKTGDWIAVPRNVMHSARVVGSESVVSLDAIKN